MRKIKRNADEPGHSPLHCWEGFKAAIRSSDLSRMLTYITPLQRTKNATDLIALQPHWPEFVEGMEAMTVDERGPQWVNPTSAVGKKIMDFEKIFPHRISDEDNTTRF